jgi:hypothetical protein
MIIYTTRFELKPTWQKAEALLYEPHSTLKEPRRTLKWATPHPIMSHAAP